MIYEYCTFFFKFSNEKRPRTIVSLFKFSNEKRVQWAINCLLQCVAVIRILYVLHCTACSSALQCVLQCVAGIFQCRVHCMVQCVAACVAVCGTACCRYIHVLYALHVAVCCRVCYIKEMRALRVAVRCSVCCSVLQCVLQCVCSVLQVYTRMVYIE